MDQWFVDVRTAVGGPERSRGNTAQVMAGCMMAPPTRADRMPLRIHAAAQAAAAKAAASWSPEAREVIAPLDAETAKRAAAHQKREARRERRAANKRRAKQGR